MPSPHVSSYGANLVTASTLTITADAYAGQKIILDRAAGITATLPAATGSGNSYEFFFIHYTTTTLNLAELTINHFQYSQALQFEH